MKKINGRNYQSVHIDIPVTNKQFINKLDKNIKLCDGIIESMVIKNPWYAIYARLTLTFLIPYSEIERFNKL